MADRSLIAIVTPAFGSAESIEALKREVGDGDGATEVRLVAPAVEINPLHHTLGDIDKPRAEAGERLESQTAAARDAGLTVSGEVVGPLRLKVKLPSTGPVSDALASVACTFTDVVASEMVMVAFGLLPVT